jgi:DNA polymerase-4
MTDGNDRQRKIIHVDMDAFYASVEQRDNPELRGKPVAVGGSRERGVVAAASYEARKFGVRSAMPSVTAKRQCPNLIFVKPRFEVYKAVSQQMREIFAEHTPIIEPLSLDEAYLDVTENLQRIPLARDVALAIRSKIKEVTGLNASAGISYNKFLAKLASDHRKPNGQYVITPEMGPAFVEGLPVGKFHGIGPATSTRMNALGLLTGLDMRNQSLEFMQANFGKAGAYYYWISRGVDNREVQTNRIRKSVGAENTFSSDLTEFDNMASELTPLVDKVWRYCEDKEACGRTVTLKVKFADFELITRSRTLAAPIESRSSLESVTLDLLRMVFPLEKAVRLLGVSVSGFVGDDESSCGGGKLTLPVALGQLRQPDPRPHEKQVEFWTRSKSGRRRQRARRDRRGPRRDLRLRESAHQTAGDRGQWPHRRRRPGAGQRATGKRRTGSSTHFS